MADILLRASLARGLTNDEVDANLVALNDELSTKVDLAGARAAISVSGALSYNVGTGVISFTDAVTSVAGKTGAVTLTKSDVGLSAVENKSSSTIRSELTLGNVTSALGFTPPASDGSGASGTWGISVSGNAGTAYSAAKWTTARTLTLTGDVTGSVSMDGAGNVSMSTAVGNDSHLHTQLYREDNRTLAPSELGAGYMRFGFTSWANNGSSPYADFIHLRSYTDSSGGADNLVMFRKSAPGMRIWQQAWGSSTAYSSYVDVLDSSNYTSWVGNGAMTVTAGSGLTGGGLLGAANQSGATSVTISHADTSSQASVNNSGTTFIQDVTLDTYGHVTGLSSATVSIGDGAMTVAAGSGLSGGGQLGTANQSGASSVTLSHADTSSQASVNNSNGTVIQGVTLDTYGHVTGLTSKTLGYADIGAPSTTGTNASGTWAISITGSAAYASSAGNADTVDGVHASGFVSTTYNSSLNGDSRNSRGVTRLYRRDDNSDYSVQHYWTGSHWYLQGFSGDSFHAHCRVGYADSAGSAPANGGTSSAVTINYNNDSNSTYQMLWGSGNSVYGTGGIYCNPSTDYLYAGAFYCANWHRSSGATGWYNESYGGGIYMVDTTWVRVYNSKAFYVANSIAATGDVTAYYSDERLKTKAGHISGALSKVLSLNGFYYRENDLAKSFGYSSDRVQMALSAQDVQKVAPEVVSLAPFDMLTDETSGEITSKSGENYLTVNYARLVPLLVEAIKEQDARIDRLTKRLAQLTEGMQ